MAGTSSAKTRFALLPGHDEKENHFQVVRKSQKCWLHFKSDSQAARTRNPTRTRQPMLYAILAYHVEEDVTSWTPQEDAALMVDLNKVHDRLDREGRMGPAARLGATRGACVLRGPGKGVVTDGPFSESKEQLLGFYVIDCANRDAAISAARDLRQVN